MPQIFIVSDGTGWTAEQVVQAALTQFLDVQTVFHRFPDVRSSEQVLSVIEEAALAKGVIVHTLVSDELRNLLIQRSRLQNVDTIDLLGPILRRLAVQIDDDPSERPGLFRKMNEAYFRRLEAIDYALRHDDGQHVEELHDADIVLIGVSRTFKSPLCMYLALKGYQAANIPLGLGLPVPDILSELPPEHVVGLTTTPRYLSMLRKARHNRLKQGTGTYADIDYVRRELVYLADLYHKHPDWAVIDVTHKPIEEIAAEILSLFQEQV